MNLNWKKNVESDLELDRELNSPIQMEVARLVRELPEEVPSMAWRSSLNDKIRLQAAQVRRKKMVINWVFRPALGLGLASVAALMMFTHTAPPASRPDKSAEVADAIVRTYSDELQNREVTYTPVSLEAPQPPAPSENSADPYAEDVTDSI